MDARFGRAERERAVSFLERPSARAEARLEAWTEEGGYFVTTGQQPGLFTGPLYTLYKALSAIALASELEDTVGRPVLPLFWIGSEDHDWDEVDHVSVLDTENELHTLRLPPPGGASNRPIHRIRLGPEITALTDELSQLLPSSDFSASYLELLRNGYTPNGTLSEGFLEVLQALLDAYPILFVDAATPALKEASLPLLLREMEASQAHEAGLAAVVSRLAEAGYEAQVPILPGGMNLFLEGPEGRDRLYRDGGEARLRHSDIRLSFDDVRARAQADPTVLSPNVLLRPVVESALLPTISYVGGPGEVAYFAQLDPLFQAHGMSMPVVFPRHSVILFEGKIAKVLSKLGLEPKALAEPPHELATSWARQEVPEEVQEALDELREALGTGGRALTEAIRGLDPTLKGPITHARNLALGAFNDVEKKIIRAVKRENEIALAQLDKAQTHLFPTGQPQERVFNPFYYLVRYGPKLIPSILGSFRVPFDPDSA